MMLDHPYPVLRWSDRRLIHLRWRLMTRAREAKTQTKTHTLRNGCRGALLMSAARHQALSDSSALLVPHDIPSL
jgi:hypothetical protein